MNAPLRCIDPSCAEELHGDLTRCGVCGKRQPVMPQTRPEPEPVPAPEVIAAPVAQTESDKQTAQETTAPIVSEAASSVVKVKPGGSKSTVVVMLALLLAGGGGYWAWSQKLAADQRVAELQEQQAQEAQRRLEEQRAKELKEAEERGRKEAEEKIKQELAQKEAEERAKAEAEQAKAEVERAKSEAEQARLDTERAKAEFERAKAQAERERRQAGGQTSRNSDALMTQATRCADTRQCLSVILSAADPASPQALLAAVARIRELPAPVSRGDSAAGNDLNRRAVEEARRNDQNAALDLLRRAVQADPSNASAQGNLGVVLLRSGRKDEAWGALLLSLQLDPGREFTWQGIAEYLAATSKTELAVRALLTHHEVAKDKRQALANIESLAKGSNTNLRPVAEQALSKIRVR